MTAIFLEHVHERRALHQQLLAVAHPDAAAPVLIIPGGMNADTTVVAPGKVRDRRTSIEEIPELLASPADRG